MRPGRLRFRGRPPSPHSEQILLSSACTLDVLPHALTQDLSRSLAIGAARFHKRLAEIALHTHPQTRIFGFERHGGSLSSGYTVVYPFIDGYSPVAI
jgi:hypothetical protein